MGRRPIFWVTLLIVALVGAWLWDQASAAMSGPLTPLLNFLAGLAVAAAAVLIARRAVRLDGRKNSKK